MTASNEELTKAVLTISSLLSVMLELQTTLAEIVTPIASNLNDQQKADLFFALSEGRKLAAGIRETAQQLEQR